MKTLSALLGLVLLLCSCVGCPKAPDPQLLEWESVALVIEDTSRIYCSGTWVDHDKVLTAAHCMLDAQIGDRVIVMDRGQHQHLGYWTAQVDKHLDLAVINVWHPPAVHRSARVSHRDPRDGDRVYMTGNPLGLGWSYMESVVSSERQFDVGADEENVRMVQIQGPICMGQSGSSAFDSDGRIMGVIVRIKGGPFDRCGIGVAVHRSVVEKFLSDG